MTKRVTRRPSVNAARRFPQEQLDSEKARSCLLLFLCGLALTAGLDVWVRAPIQHAIAPLQLQLYPTEYCLLEGLNADAKSEHLESLRRDSWYFAPLYTLSFLFLGFTVFCAGGTEWRYGVALMIFALFAAQGDFLENHHLEQCLDGNDAAATAAYAWTRWKWAMLSFVTAVLAPHFLVRQDWRRILGYLLTIGGGLGTVALLPTEKIAPVLRYLLIPLLTANLSLVWIALLVELLRAVRK